MAYRAYLQPRLEAAEHVQSLLQAMQGCINSGDGNAVAAVEHTLDPYRELYRQAGSKYGAADSGMLRWYYDRAHQYGFSPRAREGRYTALKRRAAA